MQIQIQIQPFFFQRARSRARVHASCGERVLKRLLVLKEFATCGALCFLTPVDHAPLGVGRRPTPPGRMWSGLPHELLLLVFDLAVAAGDANTNKALRRVTRECALRYARSVWIFGARTWYLDYMRSLRPAQYWVTARLLLPTGCPRSYDLAGRTAAVVAAQATSEAMPDDALLFRALRKCTKFRTLGAANRNGLCSYVKYSGP